MTNPELLTVGLGERSYRILIGEHVMGNLPDELRRSGFPKRIAVVTNTTVGELYGDACCRLLAAGGYVPEVITIPDGEEFKTLAVLEEVLGQLIANNFDRSTGLLALGGGVVGDLAGFAAAVYLRGVPFVQVPTTLLAQVDSSVGGKTAVNHALGKNMIGAFYQPRLVLIDVATLATLPERDLVAGLAEVVKYGIIRDRDFFAWLEASRSELLAKQPQALIEAVKRSCQIKANIVENDEKESGLRAVLNYGHTFGHAVEQLAGYGVYRHGEAVAIGMVIASRLAQREGLCAAGETRRIFDLLKAFGLPTDPPGFPLSQYLEAMGRDKKVQQGTLRMVLNLGVGDCLVRPVDDPERIFADLLSTFATRQDDHV